MHILIDASSLGSAPHEARSYFRGMVRHLLLATEWHACSFVAWPQAKLGRLADFLAPLSRFAKAKLVVMPAAGEPAVVYAPVGLPGAERGVFRFLTRGGPVASVGTVLDEEPNRCVIGADRIVTLTRSGMEALIQRSGLTGDRVRWIPPGLDAHAPRGRETNAIVLPATEYVAASGIGPRPSPAALAAVRRVLTAFRLFRKRTGRSVRLVLIDGAPCLFRQAAKCLGLAACVDFLSTTRCVGDYERTRVIASATAFIHASRPDTSWLSAAEAMRRGVPVIVPRTLMAREVFGDIGLYYPEGSASGLADELARLFASEELRRGLARHGMLRGQTLSWEASARQVLALFDELSEAFSFRERKVGDAAGSGYNPPLASHAHNRIGKLE